jgi:hypothetical protein
VPLSPRKKKSSIFWHLHTSREVHRKLSQAARVMGLKPNGRARALAICIDAILAHAQSLGRSMVRYGRVPASSVQAIRRADEKIVALAAEYKLSEAMICAIRARKCYDWVK